MSKYALLADHLQAVLPQSVQLLCFNLLHLYHLGALVMRLTRIDRLIHAHDPSPAGRCSHPRQCMLAIHCAALDAHEVTAG